MRDRASKAQSREEEPAEKPLQAVKGGAKKTKQKMNNKRKIITVPAEDGQPVPKSIKNRRRHSTNFDASVEDIIAIEKRLNDVIKQNTTLLDQNKDNERLRKQEQAAAKKELAEKDKALKKAQDQVLNAEKEALDVRQRLAQIEEKLLNSTTRTSSHPAAPQTSVCPTVNIAAPLSNGSQGTLWQA